MSLHHLNPDYEKCDTCKAFLLDVGEEVYCPNCDIGDKVQPDDENAINHCDGCNIQIATWYPFDACPRCYNAMPSGEHKVGE